MATAPSSTLDSRREQTFPQLTREQVAAARRFMAARRTGSSPDEILVRFGRRGGAGVARALRLYRSRAPRCLRQLREVITRHVPGMMGGELSQLAGGPSFVEARASPEGREAIPSIRLTCARRLSATLKWARS